MPIIVSRDAAARLRTVQLAAMSLQQELETAGVELSGLVEESQALQALADIGNAPPISTSAEVCVPLYDRRCTSSVIIVRPR